MYTKTEPQHATNRFIIYSLRVTSLSANFCICKSGSHDLPTSVFLVLGLHELATNPEIRCLCLPWNISSRLLYSFKISLDYIPDNFRM